MRSASRPHSGAGGRKMSVGQSTNASMIGRTAASSWRHSGHSSTCASNADLSLAGSARSAYSATRSVRSQPVFDGAVMTGLLRPSSALRSLASAERTRVFTVPSGCSRRAAVSEYVSSEKNAVSIACRSSGVSAVNACSQQAAPPPCFNGIVRTLDLLRLAMVCPAREFASCAARTGAGRSPSIALDS